MDSKTHPLAKPQWFGTPWHGVIYRVGNAPRLRPNGTSGTLDRPADAAGVSRTMATWDIGKQAPETPEEVVALGGKFLGRSLFNPGLFIWRPLLLNEVVCRALVRWDLTTGFTLQLRAFDPLTGQLGPQVSVATGQLSNAALGQGPDQPSVEGLNLPNTIGTFSYLDASQDGRSILLGIGPFSSIDSVRFTGIYGLIRLDIGGNPAAPTLSMTVLANRADALGVDIFEQTLEATNKQWTRAPDEVITGPCGVTRRTAPGSMLAADTPYTEANAPSSLVVIREGTLRQLRGFSGRLLTAWFEADGSVHQERYDCTRETVHTVAGFDNSSGQNITTISYDANCNVIGRQEDFTLYISMLKRSEISERFTLSIAGYSVSAMFSEVSVLNNRDNSGGFFREVPIERTGTLDDISGAESVNSTGRTHSLPEVAPSPPTQRPGFIFAVRDSSVPGGGYELHPALCGWKCASLCRTKVEVAGAPVEVKAWPAITPAGLVGSTEFYTSNIGAGLSTATRREFAARNGTFNPLAGQIARGWVDEIVGCI